MLYLRDKVPDLKYVIHFSRSIFNGFPLSIDKGVFSLRPYIDVSLSLNIFKSYINCKEDLLFVFLKSTYFYREIIKMFL